MPEEEPEHTITESDNQGRIEAATPLLANWQKLLAKGLHWSAIAFGGSHIVVDWAFEDALREDFESIARSLIASQRYTARRYFKEIIEPGPQNRAKALFDLLEEDGIECIET
jgi:hypothetical protein